MGLILTEPRLLHSVGVALGRNEVDVFFEKGSLLPLRAKRLYRTLFDLGLEEKEGRLRAPLVEGERGRADRNRHIGYLEIPRDALRGEIPAGSVVELTLDIDTSRRVRAYALIPILNQEFEAILELELPPSERETLQEKAEHDTAPLADPMKSALEAKVESGRALVRDFVREH